MEVSHCKKCGREKATTKAVCEYCRKKTNESWINYGKNTLSIAGVIGAIGLPILKTIKKKK